MNVAVEKQKDSNSRPKEHILADFIDKEYGLLPMRGPVIFPFSLFMIIVLSSNYPFSVVHTTLSLLLSYILAHISCKYIITLYFLSAKRYLKLVDMQKYYYEYYTSGSQDLDYKMYEADIGILFVYYFRKLIADILSGVLILWLLCCGIVLTFVFILAKYNLSNVTAAEFLSASFAGALSYYCYNYYLFQIWTDKIRPGYIKESDE